MSVRDALKGIQKVDKNTSLSSKYTTICETIKRSINTNKASIKSAVGYSGGSVSLTKEYISGMTLHTSDMKGYIQSGEGVYKPVRRWYSTGTYSSGAYRTVYLHH